MNRVIGTQLVDMNTNTTTLQQSQMNTSTFNLSTMWLTLNRHRLISSNPTSLQKCHKIRPCLERNGRQPQHASFKREKPDCSTNIYTSSVLCLVVKLATVRYFRDN